MLLRSVRKQHIILRERPGPDRTFWIVFDAVLSSIDPGRAATQDNPPPGFSDAFGPPSGTVGPGRIAARPAGYRRRDKARKNANERPAAPSGILGRF
jgi:hypothetical protein